MRIHSTMRTLRASLVISSLLVLTFALTGCDHVGLLFGTKVHIAKLPVNDVDLLLQGDPGIAPGESKSLIATFTDIQNKTYATQGAGKGKILWSDLQVTPSVVTYKKGVITLPHDPRSTEGKTAHIDLAVPSHPTLHASLDVPLRYDYAFTAAYAGSSGSDGTNGSDGTAGSSGSDGSIDPNNPTPGGNGGNGTSGSNGGNGSDGANGPDVTARITLRTGAKPMLQAVVSASGHHDRYYLIDPNGGSLTITSTGGSGGAGGRGGSGGQGGSGGVGIPPGSSGTSGTDGTSGLAGSNGAPGRITVTYDPSVQPYLSVIHAGTGKNPKVTFNQAPVPQLW